MSNDMEIETLINQLKQKMKSERNNVLVIPDLHAPFTKTGFLEHCKKVYEDYNCSDVIILGDEVDHHYSSFHDSCPDGDGAMRELNQAIAVLKGYYEAFPSAVVTVGNHTNIIARKMFSAGLSKRWMRDYAEVLEVPNWTFTDSFFKDGVYYCHGQGRKAKQRMIKEGVSVVQGHWHYDSEIGFQYNYLGEVKFYMQLGCGIDADSYAMAYAKNFGTPNLNCGVVAGNGKIPLIVPFIKSSN